MYFPQRTVITSYIVSVESHHISNIRMQYV